jgi:hypothetical protein
MPWFRKGGYPLPSIVGGVVAVRHSRRRISGIKPARDVYPTIEQGPLLLLYPFRDRGSGRPRACRDHRQERTYGDRRNECLAHEGCERGKRGSRGQLLERGGEKIVRTEAGWPVAMQ